MTYPYQPPPPDDHQQPGPYYQQQPIYPYGFVAPRQTDGLAIASLVVSCAAVLGLCAYGIGGVLGLVGAGLGHAARRRIARSGADGAGMALAGVIVGWIAAGIAALAITGIVVLIAMDPDFS